MRSSFSSSKDGSSPGYLTGRTAPSRLNQGVLVALVLLFLVVGTYSLSNLRSAFRAAYKDSPKLEQEPQKNVVIQSEQEAMLHTDYFTPEVVRWSHQILAWSEQNALPPDLIAIVMQIESCGDQHARSSAGAMGIFQVMPFHFGSGEDPWDLQINAERGLAYLAKGYRRSNQEIDLTLAGYNGGHTMIETHPDQWPSETKRYVKWGVGIWEDIQSGRKPSPALEQWLSAGGSHLCQSASVSTVRAVETN